MLIRTAGTILMLGEKRRKLRHTINRVAKFLTETGGLARDCMITDISDTGARLFADGVEVPAKFQLLISGEKEIRRECQVVWRLGGEIGVSFVDPVPSR
jgi:PilZ domain